MADLNKLKRINHISVRDENSNTVSDPVPVTANAEHIYLHEDADSTATLEDLVNGEKGDHVKISTYRPTENEIKSLVNLNRAYIRDSLIAMPTIASSIDDPQFLEEFSNNTYTLSGTFFLHNPEDLKMATIEEYDSLNNKYRAKYLTDSIDVYAQGSETYSPNDYVYISIPASDAEDQKKYIVTKAHYVIFNNELVLIQNIPGANNKVYCISFNIISNKLKQFSFIKNGVDAGETIETQLGYYMATDLGNDDSYKEQFPSAHLMYNRLNDLEDQLNEAIAANEINPQNLFLARQGNKIYPGYDTVQSTQGINFESIDVNKMGLYQDSKGIVYPTYGGKKSSQGIPLATKGDGTGNNYSYTPLLNDGLDERNFTIAKRDNGEFIINFVYTSINAATGAKDGKGNCSIIVNGDPKKVFSVQQNQPYPEDIYPYISEAGYYEVELRATNSIGASFSLFYYIDVIELAISTNASKFQIVDQGASSLTLGVSLSGGTTVEKTIRAKIDGIDVLNPGDNPGLKTLSSSENITIPVNFDYSGDHILTLFVEATIDGHHVSTEKTPIKIGLLYIQPGNTSPVLSALCDTTSISDGENFSIDFYAYNPASNPTSVQLSIIDPNNPDYHWSKIVSAGRRKEEWAIQEYPLGDNIEFQVQLSLGATKTFKVNINESNYQYANKPLLLDFNAKGRSNNEKNPEQWTGQWIDGNNIPQTISAQFNNVGFTSVDGWVTDDKSAAVLRLMPKSSMTLLGFSVFDKFTNQTGGTIEVEMATHSVNNYDAVVVDVFKDSNNSGLKIASQNATLRNASTVLSTYFKEDDRVRLSFVIDQTPESLDVNPNTKYLITTYINGIMSGVKQIFEPIDITNKELITIGADASGIDIYEIKVYNQPLTAKEIVQNFIASRPTITEKKTIFDNNNIYNSKGVVSPALLPANLPYMIITGTLPEQKSDEDKPICEIEYVDKINTNKSFTATKVEVSVQGTSSAGYRKKNFKIKFDKNTPTIQLKGQAEKVKKYQLRDDSIPVRTFCLKADVASSENANNVELVRLYNDLCPYKTPAQEKYDEWTADGGATALNNLKNNFPDGRPRFGIDGLPIALFWRPNKSAEPVFWGKYNFNNDKSNHEVFGLEAPFFNQPNEEGINPCESWEIRENGLARVIFKSSDFDTIVTDNDGNFKSYEWEAAFEPRYHKEEDKITDKKNPPTPEENRKYTANFKRLTDWLASCYRGDPDREIQDLNPPVTIGAKTYDKDTDEYRLAKFKAEADQYLLIDHMCFYYLFTEVFLLVDSRAKNFFPTTYDGIHWLPLPYDMDTALGINNTGSLTFGYELDDKDTVGGGDSGAEVFNGSKSALWTNIRDGFQSRLQELYISLRGTENRKLFGYEGITQRFSEHQKAWPENLWNEDAFEKYLKPWREPSTNDAVDTKEYLPMLQGNKESQREWWLDNAFKYRDSKYSTENNPAGLAKVDGYFFNLRAEQPEHGGIDNSNISFEIVPYRHLYPFVKLGGGSMTRDTSGRVSKNTPITMKYSTDTSLTNTEFEIWSGDSLAEIGDLTHFHVGRNIFAAGAKLRTLKIFAPIVGMDDNGNEKYSSVKNMSYEEPVFSRMPLLEEVWIVNCETVKTEGQTESSPFTLNFGQCPNLERVHLRGSTISEVNFSKGGRLKSLEFPSCLTKLTLLEQPFIESYDADQTKSKIIFDDLKDPTISTPIAFSEMNIPNLKSIRIEKTALTDLGELIQKAKPEKLRLINADWKEQSYATLLETLKTIDSVDYALDDAGQPIIKSTEIEKCEALAAAISGTVTIRDEYKVGEEEEIKKDLLKLVIKRDKLKNSQSILENEYYFPNLTIVLNNKVYCFIRYLDRAGHEIIKIHSYDLEGDQKYIPGSELQIMPSDLSGFVTVVNKEDDREERWWRWKDLNDEVQITKSQIIEGDYIPFYKVNFYTYNTDLIMTLYYETMIPLGYPVNYSGLTVPTPSTIKAFYQGEYSSLSFKNWKTEYTDINGKIVIIDPFDLSVTKVDRPLEIYASYNIVKVQHKVTVKLVRSSNESNQIETLGTKSFDHNHQLTIEDFSEFQTQLPTVDDNGNQYSYLWAPINYFLNAKLTGPLTVKVIQLYANELTDSWEEIAKNTSVYPIGSYKTFELDGETYTMQVIANNKDYVYNAETDLERQGKAANTWFLKHTGETAEDCPKILQNVEWGPDLKIESENSYQYAGDEEASWIVAKNLTWTPINTLGAKNDASAEITFTIVFKNNEAFALNGANFQFSVTSLLTNDISLQVSINGEPQPVTFNGKKYNLQIARDISKEINVKFIYFKSKGGKYPHGTDYDIRNGAVLSLLDSYNPENYTFTTEMNTIEKVTGINYSIPSGAFGGWKQSYIRQHLQTNILNKLPATRAEAEGQDIPCQDELLLVKKYSLMPDLTSPIDPVQGNNEQQITYDKIWLLGGGEFQHDGHSAGIASAEQQEFAIYPFMKEGKLSLLSHSAKTCAWTRSCSAPYPRDVLFWYNTDDYSYGRTKNPTADKGSKYAAFGFCTGLVPDHQEA